MSATAQPPAGEHDDYEPTDAELGGKVTDPYDAPSYKTMITNATPQENQ